MSLAQLLDYTDDTDVPENLYTQVTFPDPPEARPYVFLNMVATADGKIVLGERNGSAQGVGGPTDQLLFRRLQKVADAALIGGSTLRASQVIYPPDKPRFVVTRGGDVPLDNRFFRDAPDRAYILAPADLNPEVAARLQTGARLIQAGNGDVDMAAALQILRQEWGVRHLLCEGGATLNDILLRAGLVDELFLTLTNKLKGGSHLPTVVDGQGFAPGQYAPLTVRSLYHDGDEFYFRYKICLGGAC